jgi:hypothetical protein
MACKQAFSCHHAASKQRCQIIKGNSKAIGHYNFCSIVPVVRLDASRGPLPPFLLITAGACIEWMGCTVLALPVIGVVVPLTVGGAWAVEARSVVGPLEAVGVGDAEPGSTCWDTAVEIVRFLSRDDWRHSSGKNGSRKGNAATDACLICERYCR